MNTPEDKLKELFTVPSPAPTNFGLTPGRLPGPTYDSAQALLECLRHNHLKQHIFFNDRGFHNHATHHLYAIYAMGADRKLLEAAYQTHVVYQRPAFESPGPIDDGNWKDHLADEKYFQAYVKFFSDKFLAEGPSKTFETGSNLLEKYILSKDANVIPGKGKDAPNMLSRFYGGFVHPWIHTGYGAEFNSSGMWAEGLAEACVHGTDAVNLFLPALFDGQTSSGGITSVISRVASLGLSSGQPKKSSPHALEILARILKDPDFSPKSLGLSSDNVVGAVEKVATACEAKLLKFFGEWVVSPDRDDLLKKTEELIWMNSVIYTIGGWSGRNKGTDEKKEFNADFFLMHLVTSVIFVPSLISHLSHQSAVLLLRTYLLVSLVLYVSRGRPAIPIEEFYKSTTATPSQPGPQPTPSEKSYVDESALELGDDPGKVVWKAVANHLTPNPWLPIVQTTLLHPNEHLCKTQRSLLHFANLFGETAPGHFESLGTEGGLEGAKLLDGTLFVRAAGLTANRLGWMREGQAERGWDRDGFYYDD